MKSYALSDIIAVRSIKIGSVFQNGNLERMVIGVEWSKKYQTWCIQWCRRGSNSSNQTVLGTWLKWQSGAKQIFDAIDGPWKECVL